MEWQNCNFDKDFDLKGVWWAAGNGRRKVTGTLIFEAKKSIRLDLDANLRSMRRANPLTQPPLVLMGLYPPNDSVILGQLDSGTPVTLMKCFWTNSNGIRQTFAANLVIFGRHYLTLDAVRIASFEFSASQLEEWVGRNPFTRGTDGKTTIGYVEPELISFQVISAKMKMELKGTPMVRIRYFKDITIEHLYRLTITPNKAIGWDKFMQRLEETRQLLMLLYGAPVALRHLFAYPPDKVPSNDGLYEHLLNIVYVENTKLPENLNFANMLFPHYEISDFPEVCEKWYRSCKRLKGLHEVFFSNMRKRPPFTEQRFFSAAQSLEAFHRKAMVRGNGKSISKRRWKVIRERIYASLPIRLNQSIKDLVKRKLDDANDYSFQDRLKAIFGSLDKATAEIITTDVPQFIKAIVHTRNWFTHLERGRKSKPFERDDWYKASDKMELLLLIMMQTYCGLPEDKIRERLSKSHGYFQNQPFSFPDYVPPPIPLVTNMSI